MKPEVQRIAIAEACPDVFHINTFSDGKTQIIWACNKKIQGQVETVDPLTDLNAMHEAWKTRVSDLRGFESILGEVVLGIVGLNNNHYGPNEIEVYGINATAAQRAEAFLRTLNLWTS